VSRKLLDNNFCTIPWTGFELEPNGAIKNCIISKEQLGNINHTDIQDILADTTAISIKQQMLKGEYPSNCEGCYFQEKNRKKSFDNISSRTYYAKEVGPHVTKNLFDSADNFELRHVDLRWSNKCNQACVYCGPQYSSKWAKELNKKVESDREARTKLKEYVFANINNLKNIYLAGGEPLLMNENREFLELLLKENAEVHIRVNTNLSHTNTGVFELLQKFKNVHWTVSVESIGKQYEYIRHGGNWNEFLKNLVIIKHNADHKISFNMLYFILNYHSLFDCVSYFQNMGFGNNSFVIGPLYGPEYLNILNLPDDVIIQLKLKFQTEIDKKPGFLLRNSYENILKYLDEPFDKDLNKTYNSITAMDKRRNIDSRTVFVELYEEIFDKEITK
jgi:radical SAM protein with 4Fe4S-binding SPASM domain